MDRGFAAFRAGSAAFRGRFAAVRGGFAAVRGGSAALVGGFAAWETVLHGGKEFARRDEFAGGNEFVDVQRFWGVLASQRLRNRCPGPESRVDVCPESFLAFPGRACRRERAQTQPRGRVLTLDGPIGRRTVRLKRRPRTAAPPSIRLQVFGGGRLAGPRRRRRRMWAGSSASGRGRSSYARHDQKERCYKTLAVCVSPLCAS